MKNYAKLLILLYSIKLSGYGLPGINLGNTNFLDGGPIRPSPGFYFFQYFDYYYSNDFKDGFGKTIPGLKNTRFNDFAGATQFVYQTEDDKFLRAAGGVSLVVPYSLFSSISKNELDITDRGQGFGNVSFGGYLQWKPIQYKSRPLFVHRLELDFLLPHSKIEPLTVIFPFVSFFCIDMYWAATLYLSERWALSWRLNYLIPFKDKINDQKIGRAFYANYSLAYQTTEHLWLGINGYFLQQLQNDKFSGVIAENSKERVLGLGPGGVYFFSQDFILFGHLYFETLARNRPQGFKFTTNIVLHF